jgi:hypothetical protein
MGIERKGIEIYDFWSLSYRVGITNRDQHLVSVVKSETCQQLKGAAYRILTGERCVMNVGGAIDCGEI